MGPNQEDEAENRQQFQAPCGCAMQHKGTQAQIDEKENSKGVGWPAGEVQQSGQQDEVQRHDRSQDGRFLKLRVMLRIHPSSSNEPASKGQIGNRCECQYRE